MAGPAQKRGSPAWVRGHLAKSRDHAGHGGLVLAFRRRGDPRGRMRKTRNLQDQQGEEECTPLRQSDTGRSPSCSAFLAGCPMDRAESCGKRTSRARDRSGGGDRRARGRDCTRPTAGDHVGSRGADGSNGPCPLGASARCPVAARSRSNTVRQEGGGGGNALDTGSTSSEHGGPVPRPTRRMF